MRITAPSVEHRAGRQAERTFTREEQVRARVDAPAPERGAANPAPVPAPDPGGGAPQEGTETPPSRHDVDLLILTRAFRLDLRIFGAAEMARGHADGQARAAGTQASAQEAQAREAPERVGWGLEVEVREREAERVPVALPASGKVRTTDGRRLDLSLALSPERVRVQERSLSLRAGDAQRTDPIALALLGGAAGGLRWPPPGARRRRLRGAGRPPRPRFRLARQGARRRPKGDRRRRAVRPVQRRRLR